MEPDRIEKNTDPSRNTRGGPRIATAFRPDGLVSRIDEPNQPVMNRNNQDVKPATSIKPIKYKGLERLV